MPNGDKRPTCHPSIGYTRSLDRAPEYSDTRVKNKLARGENRNCSSIRKSRGLFRPMGIDQKIQVKKLKSQVTGGRKRAVNWSSNLGLTAGYLTPGFIAGSGLGLPPYTIITTSNSVKRWQSVEPGEAYICAGARSLKKSLDVRPSNPNLGPKSYLTNDYVFGISEAYGSPRILPHPRDGGGLATPVSAVSMIWASQATGAPPCVSKMLRGLRKDPQGIFIQDQLEISYANSQPLPLPEKLLRAPLLPVFLFIISRRLVPTVLAVESLYHQRRIELYSLRWRGVKVRLVETGV
ncbi:hypothetical protein TNCV_2069171 [Trichonephila clavipes]|uniref:Uncharacterized protein n=1 Tax=Trichonephila clavipes TaxID=2585209 RepID=A0A8X6W3D0_TRICX|nr:hypothetical protein TNCV_2069171 [Trichonephila clavipes]